VLFIEADLEDAAVTTIKLAPYAATRVLFAYEALAYAGSGAPSGDYMFLENISDVLDHGAEKLLIFSCSVVYEPPSGERYERISLIIGHQYDPGSGVIFTTRSARNNLWSPAGSTYAVVEQICIAMVLPASVSPDDVTVDRSFTSTLCEIRDSRLIMMNIKR
jgi:hypothetical protein